MDLLVAILTVALLAVVIALVSAPLRSARKPELEGASTRAELEAARESKYREIRDMELDYRTGKLSQADYETLDRTLRSEAIEILDKLRPPMPEGESRDPEDVGRDFEDAS